MGDTAVGRGRRVSTATTVSVAPDAEAEAGLSEDVVAVAGLEATETPLTDGVTVLELVVYDEEPADGAVLTASAPVDSAACDAEPELVPEVLPEVNDFAPLETGSDDTVHLDTVDASAVGDEIPAESAACTVPDMPDPTPAELDTTPSSLAQVQSAYGTPADGLAVPCSN